MSVMQSSNGSKGGTRKYINRKNLSGFAPFRVCQPQARTQGECTGCTCTPPPPTWEKGSAQKCPKEERKFRPDMSAKKNVHVPFRYDKIKLTKRVGKKEEDKERG